jgi:subtilisin family serine protease
MSWPACISNVNSVGSVYDDAFGMFSPCVSPSSCVDKLFTTGCGDFNYYVDDDTSADMVTSYSNSAQFLTFFAPSNMAYTTDISGRGGYSNGDYISSFGGTSASSPYAAGAAAVLQHAAKIKTGHYLSPYQLNNYLAIYGDMVTDSKAAVSRPRINLENAVNHLATVTTYTIVSSSTANGTIIPSGTIIAAENDTPIFFIHADSGYTIKEVSIDSHSIGAKSSYSFSPITANHTITASFEAVPEQSIFWWLPFIITLSGKQH